LKEAKKDKILIIDDDRTLCRLLEKRLTSQGFECVDVLNGRDGIKAAQEELPDMILLDLMLPDMNGRDVLRELKDDSRTKDIPVIFISVTVSKEAPKEMKMVQVEKQMYPAFPKPIYNPKLLSMIRKGINKSRDNKA